jgi:hypothetical protein
MHCPVFIFGAIIGSSEARGLLGSSVTVNAIWESATMQLGSTMGEAATEPEAENTPIAAGFPVDRAELEKLARWIPAKEMALLVEIHERARSDPDLTRPALLLCQAYAKRIARMLDQDPLPTVTKNIKDRLRQLRDRNGL